MQRAESTQQQPLSGLEGPAKLALAADTASRALRPDVTGIASLELLNAIRLACPSLPIGAYAYSQGLEYAVEAGWVRDRASAATWIGGVLDQGVGRFDVPLLARLLAAWHTGDFSIVNRLNQRVLAGRETAELQAEELHLGSALTKLLHDLGKLESLPPEQAPGHSYLSAFALAAHSFGLGQMATLTSFCFAWLEHQTSAATRLIPLGQTDGQLILSEWLAVVPRVIEEALMLHDDEVGTALPGQALASALHETQYSRLFRS